MWVCTRHPSAQLTAFPAFSSTGGTGKCHYLFRGQIFGFHASMMTLRTAEGWSIVNELGDKEYVLPAETPGPLALSLADPRNVGPTLP
jgi:hypothetical protein